MYFLIFVKSNSGMQFKYPELLWALFLLLIPIIIHLFQLRKFKKTPFTNVKMLQKVVSESRRSNNLKKWLLLFTRLLLLAALIIAFAQPFFAEKSALSTKETVIYLDDSFSMQAKTETGTLLSDAVQNLLGAIAEDKKFSLFTNLKTFTKVTAKEVQNELLTLDHTAEQLSLDQIYLKAGTLFTNDEYSIKNLIVISDFQQRMTTSIQESVAGIKINLVKVSKPLLGNISLDSAFLSTSNLENIEIKALLSSNYRLESTPVSLFNEGKLIAKTAATFKENNKGEVAFTIPAKDVIKGKIEISDTGLEYDNHLYFNIDVKEKIKVLAIGSAKTDYLKRIFTEDEFQFTAYELKNLNYSDLDSQNLIVLHELDDITNALLTSLVSFLGNNGHLIVIPSTTINLVSYNDFLSKYNATNFVERMSIERKITDISFSHPIYRDVFEKSVTNFQYPQAGQSYRIKTTAPSLLSFQDKQPFLLGTENLFVFTASLTGENSNFKNSPLIVPTFYNIGINSLKLPDLYYVLGTETELDMAYKLSKDAILKVSNETYEFIPQQKSFADKVSLSFFENPISDGLYRVMDKLNVLKTLSFNYSREESELIYNDLSNLNADSKNESISTLFRQLQNDSVVNEYWKWFVILALIFMVIEVLIQKYLK